MLALLGVIIRACEAEKRADGLLKGQVNFNRAHRPFPSLTFKREALMIAIAAARVNNLEGEAR